MAFGVEKGKGGVEQREDFKNPKKFPTLNPYKICGREAALGLFRFYERRSHRAKEEFLEVVKSYGATQSEVEAAIEAISPEEDQSHEEIVTAFANAISKTKRENQSAPNSE